MKVKSIDPVNSELPISKSLLDERIHELSRKFESFKNEINGSIALLVKENKFLKQQIETLRVIVAKHEIKLVISQKNSATKDLKPTKILSSTLCEPAEKYIFSGFFFLIILRKSIYIFKGQIVDRLKQKD